MSALDWLLLTLGPTLGGAAGWLAGAAYGRYRRAQIERDIAAIRAADRRLRYSLDSGREWSKVKTRCGVHFRRVSDGEIMECCLEAGHECAHAWWTRP